jgi:hypothetical protein
MPQDWQPPELAGIQFLQHLDHSMTYQVDDPDWQAPLLLESLVQSGVKVSEFAPLQRSLEQAYLEVIQQSGEETA